MVARIAFENGFDAFRLKSSDNALRAVGHAAQKAARRARFLRPKREIRASRRAVERASLDVFRKTWIPHRARRVRHYVKQVGLKRCPRGKQPRKRIAGDTTMGGAHSKPLFRLLHDSRKRFKLALRMPRKRRVIGENSRTFPWREHVVPLGDMNRDQHKRRASQFRAPL